MRDEDVYKDMTEIWTDEYVWEYEYLLFSNNIYENIFSEVKYLKKAHSNKQDTMQILENWCWLKWRLLILSSTSCLIKIWIRKLRI